MKTRAFALAIWMLAMGAVNAQTTSITWTNTAGGVFSEPGNWLQNAVPGVESNAFFNSSSDGTYTITFTQPTTTLHQVEFRYGDLKDITFDLGGNWFIPTGTLTAWNNAAITMRSRLDQGPHRLTLKNGTVESGKVILGSYDVDTHPEGSTLVVSEGALMRSMGVITVARGGAQKALVRIEEGGQWEHYHQGASSGDWMQLGRDSGTLGTFEVDGVGSQIDLNSGGFDVQAIIVGSSGTGVVEVTNGGKFLNARSLELARGSVDAFGSLRAVGNGSEITTTDRDISVGTTGSGLVEARDGGNIYAGRYLYVYEDGVVAVDGGTVSSSSTFRFYDNSAYLLTLNMPDTASLTAGANFLVDDNVTLEVMLAEEFSAFIGDEFILFNYENGLLAGSQKAFAGLPQDEEITVGDYTFEIDYGSESNDKAVLRVTAAPSQGTLILIQ